MKIPELLAPAGNMEKLKTAIRYGADAVYAGVEGFSLRARAGNFTLAELREARDDCQQAGVKLYAAMNIIPRDDDLHNMESAFRSLNEIGPDAIIVSDPGVLAGVRAHCPEIPIHLSTQANVINRSSAEFWFNNGVKRIVLARELSIPQITEMASGISGELEMFIHGAMCISYSGRCYLSHHMTGRDANQGDCAQSCRWSYRVLEESRRPGMHFPIEEDERGTYVFNSRDLCALPLLDRVVKTGVQSLKVEGRMKSVHYVAATIDAYRTALDLLKSGGLELFHQAVPGFLEELGKVSNREFTTAFLDGSADDHVRMESTVYANQHALVGIVTRILPDAVEISLKNPLRTGTRIEFLEPGLKRTAAVVQRIQASEGAPLEQGNPGDRVLIPGMPTVMEGAVVRC